MLDKYRFLNGLNQYWIDGLHFETYLSALQYLCKHCGYKSDSADEYLLFVEWASSHS